MKKMYKKWTIDEKEQARFLLSQYTIRQVSRKMKRSVGSIKEIASHELKDSYCRSKRYREDEGLLQSSVARKLGVSRSHINNWIKNNQLQSKKCGKKGFFVVEEQALYDWLRNGYSMLPMITPVEKELQLWMCMQRRYFTQKFISALYIKHVSNITRGALDNWIRVFNFPRPIKKIGKLGLFYDRQQVVLWARNNPRLFNARHIVRLNSYETEFEFLDNRMKCSCVA